MDPGILCFHHCQYKVFCTIIPEQCPACKQKLDRYDCNLLPFRVPYPFVKASQHPRAIVIKPTHGDFLNDYYNCKDLHIGVTDSGGAVLEFSETGVSRSSPHLWDQALLLQEFDELWTHVWDNTLAEVSSSPAWEAARYCEQRHNCLSFVLAVLRALPAASHSRAARHPAAYCRQYVVPRTAAAGKYISLYRHLKGEHFFLQRHIAET